METTGVGVRPAGGRRVWWIDSTVDVKLTGAETDGRLGMWHWEARRGAAAPLHVHDREDEQFFVIDGTARFVVDGETVDIAQGDTILLPRGVSHGYVVTSETARFIGTVTPAGFESFFLDVGTAVEGGATPESGPSREELAAGSARVGVQLLGPPPALE